MAFAWHAQLPLSAFLLVLLSPPLCPTTHFPRGLAVSPLSLCSDCSSCPECLSASVSLARCYMSFNTPPRCRLPAHPSPAWPQPVSLSFPSSMHAGNKTLQFYFLACFYLATVIQPAKTGRSRCTPHTDPGVRAFNLGVALLHYSSATLTSGLPASDQVSVQSSKAVTSSRLSLEHV